MYIYVISKLQPGDMYMSSTAGSRKTIWRRLPRAKRNQREEGISGSWNPQNVMKDYKNGQFPEVHQV